MKIRVNGVTVVNRITFVVLLLLLSPLAVDAATTVSFDVGANSANALGSSEVAGVVPAANWNLLTGTGPGPLNDSYLNAVDENGLMSGIDMTITSADEVDWQGNVYHGLSGSDAKMMRDIAYVNGPTDTLTVGFSDIGYSSYDIYLYTGAGGPDRGGSITDGTTTYFVRGFNVGAGTTDYIQGTATDYASSVAGSAGSADYVVFSGLTGATQTFTFEAIDTQIFFSGAQIVGNSGSSGSSAASSAAVPEPSSAMVFALAGFGFLTRRRRRK